MSPTTRLAAIVIEAATGALWQGCVIAGVTALLLRWTPRTTAAARHAIWALALLATVTVPLVDVVGRVARRPAGPQASSSRTSIGRSVDESAATAAARPLTSTDGLAPALPTAPTRTPRLALFTPPWPGGGWPVAGAVLMLLLSAIRVVRVGAGVLALGRIASRCVPVDEQRQRRFRGWSARRGTTGRSPRLCWSHEATRPMLLGLRRPTIVVPAVVLERLSDAELDHVALHELAHVGRWDDWTRLGQRLAEAILAFHPAVHWMARQMDLECEKACDEWVVATTGAVRPYASSLLRLGELAATSQTSSLAPGVFTARPQLTVRIESLLTIPPGRHVSPSSTRLVAASAGALACMVAGATAVPPALTFSDAPPAHTFPSATELPKVPLTAPSDVTSPPPGPSLDARLHAEAASAIAHDDPAGENPAIRRIARSALRDSAGTVIVADPTNGRVHAVVNQEWGVRRAFSPASVIKLVTALVGLREGTIDPLRTVDVRLPRRAAVDLTDAIAYSSTDYFQAAAERLDPHVLLAGAREMGLGQLTGVNLAGESSGRLPTIGPASNTRLLGGSGVGFEVTPIQLVTLVSAIANGGSVITPRRTEGDLVPLRRGSVPVTAEDRQSVVAGMLAAVSRGTAGAARDAAWSVAGKTGTWQDDDLATGLFVSFAPAEAPRFVVVVVTQGSRERGSSAAGVAGRIYPRLRLLHARREDG